MRHLFKLFASRWYICVTFPENFILFQTHRKTNIQANRRQRERSHLGVPISVILFDRPSTLFLQRSRKLNITMPAMHIIFVVSLTPKTRWRGQPKRSCCRCWCTIFPNNSCSNHCHMNSMAAFRWWTKQTDNTRSK